jgi:hypothetical protein
MSDSNPPISAKGASWKLIAAVGSILFSLGASVGTYLYTHAEQEADDRARHREVITRLDRIEDELGLDDTADARRDARIARHDTEIAVLHSQGDSLARDLTKIERHVRGR